MSHSLGSTAPDTRPLFTVYARVAGAVQGFTARGGYADAVAFMLGTGIAGRNTPAPITAADADTANHGSTGAYAAYTGPYADVLATAEHEGHAVAVTRDEAWSVGNAMPYTVVRVNGVYLGEITGSRREDDGSLTATFRVVNGYDRLTLSATAPDFSAALAMRAPQIVAAYRRLYRLAR